MSFTCEEPSLALTLLLLVVVVDMVMSALIVPMVAAFITAGDSSPPSARYEPS